MTLTATTIIVFGLVLYGVGMTILFFSLKMMGDEIIKAFNMERKKREVFIEHLKKENQHLRDALLERHIKLQP